MAEAKKPGMTEEQILALETLLSLIPSRSPEPMPDILQTWLGFSREDVSNFISGLLSQKTALEQRLLDWAARRPLESVFEFLAATSLAFYAAEKDTNPKVKTYTDAFYYIATCASVGYADIFAVTQNGRAIASLVMIVGPALTSRSLEQPRADHT